MKLEFTSNYGICTNKATTTSGDEDDDDYHVNKSVHDIPAITLSETQA